MERICIPELIGPEVSTNFFKIQNICERYVEGAYALLDVSDYNELVDRGVVSSGKEYWMFVDIFRDGVVSAEEFERFEKDEYSPCFIDKLKEIVGDDGANLLRRRMDWLGSNCLWKWYRENYSVNNRVVMIEQLAETAKSAYLTIDEKQKAIDYIKEAVSESDRAVSDSAKQALEVLGYIIPIDSSSPDRM